LAPRCRADLCLPGAAPGRVSVRRSEGSSDLAAALLAGDVPFVVLTDDEGLELEPALAGAPRLAKPVEPEALLSLVHDLLKGRNRRLSGTLRAG
jgi:hypothetical protein